MKPYYKPSGKFSPSSILFFLLITLTAFPLLGLIYAYCIWYIPIIYVNFLLTAAFGFGIGFLLRWVVIRKGKVRNIPLAILFGVLGGVIALYFHWAVWVDLVINAGESYGNNRIGITVSNIKILQVFGLAISPGLLFELIGEINAVGTWGFRGLPVSGAFLAVIWIIELLIVVGLSVLFPLGAVKEPFSEKSGTWLEEHQLPPFKYLFEKEQMIALLEKSSLEAFNSVTKTDNLAEDHSLFTLFSSEEETDYNYLSVENKLVKPNDDGKLEFDSEDVVQYIYLSPEMTTKLLEIRDAPIPIPEVEENTQTDSGDE